MRLHADSYFCIGGAHLTSGKPCQDYAMTRVSGDNAYAVVSDGCSTGGRTDVGARILALATMEAARHSQHSAVMAEQRYILTCSRDLLGLDKSDLLATCAFVGIEPSGGYFHIQGDGVRAIKRRDGSISATRYDWAKNTPYYPAYTANGEESLFLDAHGGGYEQSLEEETVDGDDGYTVSYNAATGSRGILWQFNPESIEFAAVFSDGITQIDGADWKDAVRELLAFKNVTGEFVKRRAIRFLKEIRERGKGPIDDFSMSVIRIEHDE